jgi:hypothetical protein
MILTLGHGTGWKAVHAYRPDFILFEEASAIPLISFLAFIGRPMNNQVANRGLTINPSTLEEEETTEVLVRNEQEQWPCAIYSIVIAGDINQLECKIIDPTAIPVAEMSRKNTWNEYINTCDKMRKVLEISLQSYCWKYLPEDRKTQLTVFIYYNYKI